jgi:hypothetical protein
MQIRMHHTLSSAAKLDIRWNKQSLSSALYHFAVANQK